MRGDQEGVLTDCGINLKFISHHAPVAGQLAVYHYLATLDIHAAHTERRRLVDCPGNAGIVANLLLP